MRKFALIAISLLVFSIHANAQNDWKGSYLFEEDGGKNAGGSAIFISHELSIFDTGDGLAATFRSNGYQTSTDLICSVKIQGTKIMIHFQSYGEDNMFEPYKAGDLLLTIERKTEKGKTVLLTHWGKFTPAITKHAKSGKVYFERTDTTNQ